ncbi:hypothetical protein ES332_D13G144800v1 [Gossypium tomentosum]|uniref:Uncharacterized protein n=1 Tax=Gossypium tomentosum TaxID=34277 RepID=A0A5D2HWU6_GOSTO|nr:hypothetical protein ES332_D13G144800v1 [Gossypium tomentosum]
MGILRKLSILQKYIHTYFGEMVFWSTSPDNTSSPRFSQFNYFHLSFKKRINPKELGVFFLELI